MQRQLIVIFLFFQICTGLNAQQSILLMNATVHTGTGQVIQDGAVGIRNGRIELVANALVSNPDLSAYDTVIYLKGKHLYPSFIAPNSTLGLVDIEAVRATADFAEVGNFNPHVRSLIAYNTDSDIIPTVRSNGILIAQITPRAGTISGTSSVMSLHTRNWEDGIVKKDDGVHVNWPDLYRRSWGSNEIQRNPDYLKQKEELLKFLKEAEAYQTDKGPEQQKYLPYEAMNGVFAGKKTLYIHCHLAREIEDVITLKRTNKLLRIVIVGGHDALYTAAHLKELGIPVILHRIHDLPFREGEDLDLPFKLPYLLEKEGVLFCLENSGDMEAMNTRNLPFFAGTAVAYGMEKESALTTITLNAARILGIDHRVGSIEKGKDATLFVSEGDALDMKTNRVVLAYIGGMQVDLDNHQKALYRKYMKMYDLPAVKE